MIHNPHASSATRGLAVGGTPTQDASLPASPPASRRLPHQHHSRSISSPADMPGPLNSTSGMSRSERMSMGPTRQFSLPGLSRANSLQRAVPQAYPPSSVGTTSPRDSLVPRETVANMISMEKRPALLESLRLADEIYNSEPLKPGESGWCDVGESLRLMEMLGLMEPDLESYKAQGFNVRAYLSAEELPQASIQVVLRATDAAETARPGSSSSRHGQAGGSRTRSRSVAERLIQGVSRQRSTSRRDRRLEAQASSPAASGLALRDSRPSTATGPDSPSRGRQQRSRLEMNPRLVASRIAEELASKARDQGRSVSVWLDISQYPDEVGKFNLKPAHLKPHNPLGFRARIYSPLAGEPAVGMEDHLVVRGTEKKFLGPDMNTDFKHGLGLDTGHHNDATVIGVQVRGRLMLAGHSLGGGLATVISLISGMPARTINAAGVHDNLIRRLRRQNRLQPGQILALQVKGEALTAIQKKVNRLPAAVGQEVVIDSEKSMAGWGGIKGHFMGVAIRGMEMSLQDESVLQIVERFPPFVCIAHPDQMPDLKDALLNLPDDQFRKKHREISNQVKFVTAYARQSLDGVDFKAMKFEGRFALTKSLKKQMEREWFTCFKDQGDLEEMAHFLETAKALQSMLDDSFRERARTRGHRTAARQLYGHPNVPIESAGSADASTLPSIQIEPPQESSRPNSQSDFQLVRQEEEALGQQLNALEHRLSGIYINRDFLEVSIERIRANTPQPSGKRDDRFLSPRDREEIRRLSQRLEQEDVKPLERAFQEAQQRRDEIKLQIRGYAEVDREDLNQKISELMSQRHEIVEQVQEQFSKRREEILKELAFANRVELKISTDDPEFLKLSETQQRRATNLALELLTKRVTAALRREHNLTIDGPEFTGLTEAQQARATKLARELMDAHDTPEHLQLSHVHQIKLAELDAEMNAAVATAVASLDARQEEAQQQLRSVEAFLVESSPPRTDPDAAGARGSGDTFSTSMGSPLQELIDTTPGTSDSSPFFTQQHGESSASEAERKRARRKFRYEPPPGSLLLKEPTTSSSATEEDSQTPAPSTQASPESLRGSAQASEAWGQLAERPALQRSKSSKSSTIDLQKKARRKIRYEPPPASVMIHQARTSSFASGDDERTPVPSHRTSSENLRGADGESAAPDAREMERPVITVARSRRPAAIPPSSGELPWGMSREQRQAASESLDDPFAVTPGRHTSPPAQPAAPFATARDNLQRTSSDSLDSGREPHPLLRRAQTRFDGRTRSADGQASSLRAAAASSVSLTTAQGSPRPRPPRRGPAIGAQNRPQAAAILAPHEEDDD